MLTRLAVGMLAGAVLVSPRLASAQATHVLVVEGLSGEPQYRQAFDSATARVRDAARTRWHVADSNVIVLAEEANATTGVARATREAVANAFLTLSRRVQPGDLLLVLLMGHGSGEGPASKINLPGVDATAADFASWTSGFARQTVVFVNAATGSGDFVPVLAGPNRVVVTATRTAMERNESVFAGHFATGLTSDDADADKDGRVSVMEAFRFATRETKRVYESTNRLQTEHAQVSDSLLAARVAFGGPAASRDPRVLALVAERQQLEADVAALRARKSSMPEAEYESALERLVIAIAEKTKAIRAAGGTP
jgi:hypothetical protein